MPRSTLGPERILQEVYDEDNQSLRVTGDFADADHTHATYVQTAGTYSTAGTDVLAMRVTGDTHDRLIIDADGTHSWGPGNGAVDTNLYRPAANTLRTDDLFHSADDIVARATGSAVGIGAK